MYCLNLDQIFNKIDELKTINLAPQLLQHDSIFFFNKLNSHRYLIARAFVII